jgi:hypothetical protein
MNDTHPTISPHVHDLPFRDTITAAEERLAQGHVRAACKLLSDLARAARGREGVQLMDAAWHLWRQIH